VNDITVIPDDHTAAITWTTLEPATTKIDYGFTQTLGTTLDKGAELSTNHSLTLTGLSANSTYHFHIVATNSSTNFTTGSYVFTTTNHTVLNEVFGITNSWKFSVANLDGIQWTAPNYNDSSWTSGNGILYAVQSGRSINSAIQPLGTQMPRGSTYPHVTYYLRTSFTFDTNAPAEFYDVTARIDDGAVFYLNGHEIRRIRMPDAPEVISNNTLAPNTPCNGDATCDDEFTISGQDMAYLVPGKNVLAVEVHNNKTVSPDIVFGMSLTEAVSSKPPEPPTMQTHITGNQLVIEWTGTSFILQESDTPVSGWQDVQPQVNSSPYSADLTGTSKYFRLRSN